MRHKYNINSEFSSATAPVEEGVDVVQTGEKGVAVGFKVARLRRLRCPLLVDMQDEAASIFHNLLERARSRRRRSCNEANSLNSVMGIGPIGAVASASVLQTKTSREPSTTQLEVTSPGQKKRGMKKIDFLEYAPIGPAGPTSPPRGASEHFSSPIWPLGWFCMYGGCPQRQP